MKIELPIRWTDRANDPDSLEAQRINRIVTGEDSEVEETNLVKYTYGYIVLDTNDIESFHPLDDKITIIQLYNKEYGYASTLNYEVFKEVYSEITHELIKTIQIIPQEFIDSAEEEDQPPEDNTLM